MPGAHKMGAAISGPRIAAGEFYGRAFFPVCPAEITFFKRSSLKSLLMPACRTKSARIFPLRGAIYFCANSFANCMANFQGQFQPLLEEANGHEKSIAKFTAKSIAKFTWTVKGKIHRLPLQSGSSKKSGPKKTPKHKDFTPKSHA